MRTTRGSAAALTCSLLFSSYTILNAQVPYPSGVPSQLPSKTHEELTRVHRELVERRIALRSTLAAHNAKCSKVEAGTPMAKECQAEKAGIEREIKLHAASVSAFNEAVSRAIALALSDPVKDGYLDQGLTWLGREYAKWWDDKAALETGFLLDHPELNRLNGLLDRLTPLQGASHEKLALKVLKPGKHGFLAASTKSTVYVMKEYLDLKPTDDELLFVLAHEIEHARHNHVAKQTVNIVGEKLYSFLMAKGQVSDAAYPELNASFKKMSEMRLCEHSRGHEKEADLSGAKLALAAGASPEGIKQFLDRLDTRHRAATLGLDAAAMKALREKDDHPLPEERRAYLEEALKVRF